MNATRQRLDDLLSELSRLDVRLMPTGDGDLALDAPEGTLTPDLQTRLKSCKGDLLARLASVSATCAPGPRGEVADTTGGLTDTADTEHGNEWEGIDPDDWNGCPTCGSLDAWQSCAGDPFGRTPGRWRCSTCDPPEASRRMLAAADRIRADEARRKA
jgi:hypothetical protein